jgi:hypothetical protein
MWTETRWDCECNKLIVNSVWYISNTPNINSRTHQLFGALPANTSQYVELVIHILVLNIPFSILNTGTRYGCSFIFLHIKAFCLFNSAQSYLQQAAVALDVKGLIQFLWLNIQYGAIGMLVIQKRISSGSQFRREFMIHTSVLNDFILMKLLWVTATEFTCMKENMCDMVWKQKFMKGQSDFCKGTKLGTAETVKTNGTETN